MNAILKQDNIKMDNVFKNRYYETSIYEIGVPEEYYKLLKRINSALNISLTVGNIIQLSPIEFKKTKGIGKKYIEDLLSLKYMLPDLIEKYHLKYGYKDIDTDEKSKKSCTDCNTFNDYIGSTHFYDEFQTLYAKFKLNMEDLKKIAFYCISQDNQPEAVSTINSELEKIETSLQKIISYSLRTHNDRIIPDSVYLNYYFFSLEEIKALSKLESYLKHDIDVKTLLTLNIDDLRSKKGFGFKTLERLLSIINRINLELKQTSMDIGQQDIKRNIFVPVKYVQYNIEDLDIVILEDVEAYLLSLSEKEIDIITRRWGFHRDVETLEQIGISYKTSRERIRQIESTINDGITKFFRIHPTILWKNFKEHLSSDFILKIPNLASCFLTPNFLYQFLEICFKLETGTIRDIIDPEVKINIIRRFHRRKPDTFRA